MFHVTVQLASGTYALLIAILVIQIPVCVGAVLVFVVCCFTCLFHFCFLLFSFFALAAVAAVLLLYPAIYPPCVLFCGL